MKYRILFALGLITACGKKGAEPVYPLIEVDLQVQPAKLTMSVGASAALTAIKPPGQSGLQLTWRSSDTTVASVSELGVVTARRLGTARVTVSGGQFATMSEIVVTP